MADFLIGILIVNFIEDENHIKHLIINY